MQFPIKTRLTHFKRFVLFLVLLPILTFAAGNADLPDFGDSAGSVISPEFERRLGKLFLNQVRHVEKVEDDPEVESYIQSIGYQLASHSDNAEQSFTFFVVDNPAINAFAGPGGVIGINSGVILNSSNESELAAVMAHEIAHVTQRHLARMFEQQNLLSVPTAAAMVGAILLAVVNPEAGAAALTGVSGLSAQNQISFTRANEEEADRVGMQTLVRANFNPRGMPAFFETLQRVSRYSQSAAPEFLRSHPLTTSRISDSISRAEEYPKKTYTNTQSYELIKHKLLVGSFKTPKEATNHLRAVLNRHEGSAKDKLPVRYGLAYAYIGDSDYERAEQQIDYLLKDDPDNIAYLLLAAKSKTQQSDYNSAFTIFEKSYGLFPDYKPVVKAYCRALLDVKKAKEARDILKNYERHYEHDLTTYSLLGQAEAMLGNEIETAFIQAEYYFLAANTKLAVDKLKFIKQQYKLDYYQEQRATARLAELEYELELEENLNL
ncbi:MAG: M48 family metallopeptidase [Proteobacteria bacterium]|nr:M48 family metallopeptidase [Pseudomonadota bacterium]